MKYLDLIKYFRAPIFSGQDLRLLGPKVFAYQLSLWQKQGYIVKLKNGLYAFKDQLADLSPIEISGLLYSPCCLSLEKALSHYGLIPEMVYTTTLVTPKTTRQFKNRLGAFSFRHIKPDLFFGYRQVKGKSYPYLMAEPEKALLDYIYFNLSRLKSRADIKELRLDRRSWEQNISRAKLNRYLARYKSPAMRRVIRMITKEINARS